MSEHRCAGYRTSGYWKGYPCNAVPKYEKDGKHWCKNHLPVDNRPNDGQTHFEGCYRYHHHCAIQEVERLRTKLTGQIEPGNDL